VPPNQCGIKAPFQRAAIDIAEEEEGEARGVKQPVVITCNE
jgi:hypothetical protein